MSDEERIEQLELEVKVLRDNNKGLKDKIVEQSKEIEELKDFITKLQETKDRLDSYDKENTLEIEKLKKEIEELRNEVMEKELIIDGMREDRRIAVEEIQKQYFINKDKIKEILGIEEDIDNEKLLSLLQTIVDENARLEDIEDRKVQIEYNNVFNKGVKSVENKIKAKILECRKILYSFEKELELKANKDKFIHKESMNCLLGQISILQSLLEKE